VKDETPFKYAHTEIRTRVVVICGPTRYQLDHWGAVNIFINEEIGITSLGIATVEAELQNRMGTDELELQ